MVEWQQIDCRAAGSGANTFLRSLAFGSESTVGCASVVAGADAAADDDDDADGGGDSGAVAAVDGDHGGGDVGNDDDDDGDNDDEIVRPNKMLCSAI